jgi:hypothetical protein
VRGHVDVKQEREKVWREGGVLAEHLDEAIVLERRHGGTLWVATSAGQGARAALVATDKGVLTYARASFRSLRT